MLDFELNNKLDFSLTKNDIASTSSWRNMIVLALFGGDNWWGESLFDNVSVNSFTSVALQDNVLNSQGLQAITNAATLDLDFLNEISTFRVAITLVSESRIKIAILVNELEGQPNQLFQFLWDNLKNELI